MLSSVTYCLRATPRSADLQVGQTDAPDLLTSCFLGRGQARHGTARFGELREAGVRVFPELQEALVFHERALLVARSFQQARQLEHISRLEQRR